MNQSRNRTNKKVGTIIQIIFQLIAFVVLIILLFQNYLTYTKEFSMETLQCQIKYNGTQVCLLGGEVMINEKIIPSECEDIHLCNTILAAFPITIIAIVLIGISIITIILQQTNLPLNEKTLSLVSLVLVMISSIPLVVIAFILINSNVNWWVILTQFVSAFLILLSNIFPKIGQRQKEEQSSEIINQELLKAVEIKQYTMQ
ncbi:unnamed protein product [Paramecium sonneborni]|uniref:Transmembrane protein n=1 Tax=Paramecium sonneborni TaxID=65129 RepID=A0A8S1MC81_9CILI|nr:unnamed protein product [Paramecium sonneborni]